jgi:hypothetical protein
LQLLKLFRCQIIPFILGISKKEQDAVLYNKPIIYDPDTSALSVAL